MSDIQYNPFKLSDNEGIPKGIYKKFIVVNDIMITWYTIPIGIITGEWGGALLYAISTLNTFNIFTST